MIQAVVFDMDGLLIDSEPFWRKAEMEVFADLGVTLSWEECGTTLGLRIDEVVEHWYQRKPWSGTPKEEVEKRVIWRVRELVEEHGVAKSGAYEALAFFEERDIPLAIASSSSRILIEAVVRRLSLGQYFQVIHSAENEKKGKPAPDVYLATCSLMSVSPSAALAFEDSPNGIRAAKAAGMRCVAVPEEPLPEEVSILADLVLHSLADFGENEWKSVLEKN